MRLGSLFDGSGTAPLAAKMCGIDPVWASEIEPYPIKVTKARFPAMKHLGSITEINGAEVVPVDIICGGSPCQDLSVAGKQAGIHNGERSHLFFEMTRIIREMRGASNGKYPRYVVWENVPGAFSSNQGRDFLAVLQAFAEIADPDIHVPEPESRGGRLAWKYAGEMVGNDWSIAWRTVDAQYWGVPQRRRRIYLVADFGSERAGEILFECTGVSGHTEPRGATREETAEDAGRGFEGSGGVNISFHLQQDPISSEMIAPCLSGQHQASIGVASFMGGQGVKAGGLGYQEEVAPTLKAASSGTNTVPDVIIAIHDKATRNRGGGSTRRDDGAGNGFGVQNDGTMYTMDTACRHAIAYAVDCRNGALNEELSGTLQAKLNGGQSLNFQNPVVYSSGSYGGMSEGVGTLGTGTRATAEMVAVYPKVTGPLMANSHPGSYTGQDAFSDMLPVVPTDQPQRKYIVRRLTPLECCRLQGFPDWWEDGVEGFDSARYKMWGNGMALPNMLHVMRGIARQYNEELKNEEHH